MTVPETPSTLLLVDDEPSILSALRRLLRPTGHTVITAPSGAEGLALLAATPGVALVVSDMRMPGMDGAQFLEQVRTQWPDTVRLLLTGYADMASTIDAINRGEIYRYIAKPWDDHELLLVIRQALEQRQLKHENQRLLALTQSQNAELHALNTGLAQTVAARTNELAQLNDFLNLANTQLRQQFLTTVKVFSSLLELRGGGVAGHARRVADLSRKLAHAMGMGEAQQHDVFLAALLHDIGKIGFPDSLLRRPVSVFNSRELTEYRRHAKVSENALLPLHELKDVAHMVRSHHERHDGRGFPDGLTGDDIPLGSRVIALANDFDGLVSGTHAERPCTAEQARSLIKQARGHHYHPDVVDAFLILWDRGEWLTQDTHLTPASKLAPGMVLARDFVTEQGTLLLAAEQRLTPPIIARLQAMTRRDGTELALPIRT
jgi:response regulator RpfG family c-di-GMP phosphodiesterase